MINKILYRTIIQISKQIKPQSQQISNRMLQIVQIHNINNCNFLNLTQMNRRDRKIQIKDIIINW